MSPTILRDASHANRFSPSVAIYKLIHRFLRWFKSPSAVEPSIHRQKLPWLKLLNSSR